MKLALVHDHLIQDGGAEKVLRVMQDIWPKAPTYALFYDKNNFPDFQEKEIRTSFLQKLPLALKKYQWYIGLMPAATEGHNLSEFDVVVSSSSAFSKGVITRPDAKHICYCHTPTRYLWSDTHSYVAELRAPKILKMFLPPVLSRLRSWDQIAAQRVDLFVANSKTVQERIKKYYGRDSVVIHPPVETEKFSISHEPKKYFLVGGRLVPYKRYDLIVEAFNRTGLPLKIFGTGPMEADLKKQAKGNIEFLGRISDEERAKLYSGCLAFLHPQEEDFGITAVEAMAAGRPVIALKKGGATETVVEGVTGEFFEEQIWEELADRVLRFDETKYNPEVIKAHAEKFGVEQFKQQMRHLVERMAGV
ncbi:MAG: glycosyltransferase [Patescibacteria group bacterium]|jgi:glycosyltransferase involved in cell wall biosynthesis